MRIASELAYLPLKLCGAGIAALALLAGCAGPQTLSTDRIAAIVASPDRAPADRINDVRRKPAEMLPFIGVRPGMVALDVSAARGYTTELIARAVGPTGKVYGQNAPRVEGRAPPAQAEGAAAPAAPAATPATPPALVAGGRTIPGGSRPPKNKTPLQPRG